MKQPTAGVLWTRPTFSTGDEAPNAWYSGRAERQEKAAGRFEVLTTELAAALGLPASDTRVVEATAEVALGATIEIGEVQFSRISETSLARTFASGETTFINLDETNP